MHSFISIARRFHVVSFVLAAVCFAAMSLFCQNAVMGQEAGGEETAVAADVGENNSSGQEEGATESAGEKPNVDEKDKNNHEDQKNAAEGNEEGKQDIATKDKSTESEQNKVSFWQNPWNKCKTFIGNFIGNNMNYICLAFSFISFVICFWKYTFIIPKRRRTYLEKNIASLNDFKIIASDCLKMRIPNSETRITENEKANLISHDEAKKIISDVLKKHTGEDYIVNKKTTYERFCDYWWPTYIPLSQEDAYLIILLTWDEKHNDEFEKNLQNHKKAICNIYDKRYKAFWWYWFETISFWSFFIYILPLLTAFGKVVYFWIRNFWICN